MNAPLNDPLVLSAREGAVLRLTLNRPAARNALSEGLMAALKSALEEAAADRRLRVIVLAANGPAFSSGHDLKEMTAGRAAADKGRVRFAARMMPELSPVHGADARPLGSGLGCDP